MFYSLPHLSWLSAVLDCYAKLLIGSIIDRSPVVVDWTGNVTTYYVMFVRGK